MSHCVELTWCGQSPCPHHRPPQPPVESALSVHLTCEMVSYVCVCVCLCVVQKLFTSSSSVQMSSFPFSWLHCHFLVLFQFYYVFVVVIAVVLMYLPSDCFYLYGFESAC